MEFKVFLSHRYKSPNVNLYFHALFCEIAEVQFDVDVGPVPTNVTRLERMVRDSDAIIGLYPYPADPTTTASSSELFDASKYFRLECDLAIRSLNPALVFFDQRYSQIFRFPQSIRAQPFDIQEVTGEGGSPKKAHFSNVFESFCKEVKANMALAASKPLWIERPEIGLLVPSTGPERGRYEKIHIEAIKEVLSNHGYNRTKLFHWPPELDGGYLTDIEELDWMIADVGEANMSTGIVGYLHGRFVPTLRLLKGVDSTKRIQKRKSYQGLYGGVEVGYFKDIIPWDNVNRLKEELNRRLLALKAPVKRIGNRAQGEAYFSEASLRKEAVFVSYSDKDAKLGSKITNELRKRFQEVFDYKDGVSITPGEPWLKEIFDQLSTAALGIPLMSSSYLKSKNCEHESHKMVTRRDAGKMAMIPIKLYKEDQFELPTWMTNLQYMHVYDYPDIPSIVNKLVEFFDRALRGFC